VIGLVYGRRHSNRRDSHEEINDKLGAYTSQDHAPPWAGAKRKLKRRALAMHEYQAVIRKCEAPVGSQDDVHKVPTALNELSRKLICAPAHPVPMLSRRLRGGCSLDVRHPKPWLRPSS